MEFNRFFSDQKYMNEMRPVFSKRALYSDTTENYVTPPEPAPYSRVKIAFRTKRSNVDRVFLVCKGQKNLMFKASSDAQFDYYEVKLQLDNEKISWYFEIQAGAITCYYDFRGVVKRPDEHYNFVLIPGFDTPDWAKGAVMYQIYGLDMTPRKHLLPTVASAVRSSNLSFSQIASIGFRAMRALRKR